MDSSAEMVNSGFIERLDTEGPTKTAQATVNYIKDRLREATFTDQILPNQRVVRGDLQRSTEHDTLVKIVDIEPTSRAMPLTFRGQPTATYVTGKRYAIGFFTISSLKFEIIEQELMAYEMPVTKIIEENSLKDMMELKDREFLLHTEACVNAMQEEGNGGAVAFNATNVNAGAVVGVSKIKGALALSVAVDDFVARPIQKSDITDIKKLLKRKIVDAAGITVRAGRLRPVVMLITESDADDIEKFTIEDMGGKLTGETAVDGYAYNKMVGLRMIKTIKNDILKEGNVYVFTAPEFFGRNYTLNDVKFYIDKIANRIFWQAWMDIGMGIGNIASVVKLELYGGSNIVGATDVGFEGSIPDDPEDLGKQNNKVAEGLTFPTIHVS
jgi:hypothetical protein